ncbi:MAG: SGNH/GDSL hydrolase family protein [Bacteroidia bacterium]
MGDKEWQVSDNYSFKIFNLKTYFGSSSVSKKDSVENIIRSVTQVEKEADSIIASSESVIRADTLKIRKVLQPLQLDQNFVSLIEYPDGDRSQWNYFANALSNARRKSTHILYYGDSQVEEDRFSGLFRQKLQSIYGGSGCGLLPIMPVAQWIYPKITYSDNWYKWDCYADAAKKEEYYGIMAQTFLMDFDKGAAKWTVRCNAGALPYNCLFNKVTVWYGQSKESVKVKFFNNNELINEQVLDSKDILDKKTFAVKNNDEVMFELEGSESPYIYGISLESFDNGVYVDNISLRGSSGTFFHQIDKNLLKRFVEELNVSLIILQFGGNVMPMIDSEEKAKQYGDYINYQLKVIKNICPQIPVLFVGPSDMSVNINGVMQTHPHLESVIGYIKQAVFKNGYAFFDMYRAMGGRNSMPVWVQENIAAKDYVHFSPAGARKMAMLIYYSLMKDLQTYNF